MATQCTHLDQIRRVDPRTPEGCEEGRQSDDSRVPLRLCVSYGHDSSPNGHATARHYETGHPIVPSLEAREDRAWRDPDDLLPDRSTVEAAIDYVRDAGGPS